MSYKMGPLLMVLLLTGLPAVAQVDFSGNWAPLYHEDFPERIPGPELGDYMGIPINDVIGSRPTHGNRRLRVRPGGAEGGGHGAESPARRESFSS